MLVDRVTCFFRVFHGIVDVLFAHADTTVECLVEPVPPPAVRPPDTPPLALFRVASMNCLSAEWPGASDSP